MERSALEQERDCTSVGEAPEGAFLWPGARVEGTREACEGVLHATGGAAGSVLSVDLAGFGAARVELRDWNGVVLDSVEAEGTAQIAMPWTGEALLAVLPGDSDAGGAYAIDATCIEGCDVWTLHPILLMHGMGERDPMGLAEYAAALDARGYAVWNPAVDPFNPTAIRAAQWRDWLDDWRTDGTWRQVHLVGHSMGGIDARYLASRLDPEGQIVSVTTIVTPHRGSPVADDVLQLVQEQDWADATVQTLLDILVPGHDGSQDVNAVLAQLSGPGMELFNATVPDREDVVYRSWGGVTCHWLSWDCRAQWDDETVSWGLIPSLLMLQGHGHDPSDGLVPLESTEWGEVQGVLSADHLDLGGGHAPTPSFDPVAFITREAARLAALERGGVAADEPLATGGAVGR